MANRTLVTLHIAPDIKGIPSGTIELQQVERPDKTIDYTLIVDGDELGSLPGVVNEQQAVLAGLGKMRELLVELSH